MNVIKRSGLLIPKKFSNLEQYVYIKEHLQRRSKQYNTSTYITYIFYVETKKFLLVPRNFPLYKYIPNLVIHDYTQKGSPINVTHNIVPRSKLQYKAINYLMNNNNGILQLAPGVGKTVITIYMIAERKRKSLILVHRDSLADQWQERFLEFTDLKDNSIARLSSRTFENDLKKPIIISTVQTFYHYLRDEKKSF